MCRRVSPDSQLLALVFFSGKDGGLRVKAGPEPGHGLQAFAGDDQLGGFPGKGCQRQDGPDLRRLGCQRPAEQEEHQGQGNYPVGKTSLVVFTNHGCGFFCSSGDLPGPSFHRKMGSFSAKIILPVLASGVQVSSHPGISMNLSRIIQKKRDGEVLDDPESFKTKEESKKSVLDHIFQPELHPGLYEDLHHVVRINYYPPRGDNKEGWDNIDIFGWLGYPMQIKVDFLCRDSILAAPIVLDLVLFLDLAKRSDMSGIQEWLSFYFKSPMCSPDLEPEHDLFVQLAKLKNTLRHIMGEDLITHLGLDYYKS